MLSQRAWNRLRPLLWPVALLYRGLSWWRNFFYNIGFFITRRVSVPVVSIGNLSVGGTGKTPATVYLTQYLLSLGYKVGIVSRGYGRRSSDPVLVSDGKRVLAGPEDAGDEPALLAARMDQVPVLVDEDRYRGAMTMIGRFQPDLILLDDGFQHRSLARDCDIVLLDAASPPNEYRIFPHGSLRESIAALKRADMIIWTRTNLQSPPRGLRHKVSDMGVLQMESEMLVQRQLVEVASGKIVPVEQLWGERVLAFCGVARPVTFYHALMELELEPDTVRYYPDHHHYSSDDLAYLSELASEDQLVMVTTEKDAVKLDRRFVEEHRVYVLRIEFRLVERDMETFREALSRCLPLPRAASEAGEA